MYIMVDFFIMHRLVLFPKEYPETPRQGERGKTFPNSWDLNITVSKLSSKGESKNSMMCWYENLAGKTIPVARESMLLSKYATCYIL